MPNTALTYGSVCSGIEAATDAWHVLGWRPEWFAEIEPFPSAVLAHRYPEVPNLGDMTEIAEMLSVMPDLSPDILVGGTPCQAFSVAGLREGLSDHRGQLTLSFVELANAIDSRRADLGKEPAIIVWENVPGVLSSKDNAFGCFLAGLAGEDEPLESAGQKWSNAGVVLGPQRAIAWRILDAQYFGVAQRRRRVFVVASARDGFDPAEILFEFDGVRRDTPPSRGEGEEVAGTFTSRARSGGWSQDVDLAAAGYMQVAYSTSGQGYWKEGIGPLRARTQDSHECLSVSLRGRDGGTMAELGDDLQNCLRASSGGGDKPYVLIVVHGTQDPCTSEHTAFALGRNSGGENSVLHLPFDIANTLTARMHKGINTPIDEGQTPVLAYGIRTANTSSNGWGIQEEKTHTLDQAMGVAVAFAQNTRDEVRLINGDGAIVGALAAEADMKQTSYIKQNAQVRRLTPREYERLQGFPDSYTDVPYRGKPAADGPRYKALGNSMAVPVMRWIGQRIQSYLTLQQK